MPVIGRVLRAALTACTVATFVGCDSKDPAPGPTAIVPAIDATTMRGALLQPTDIGTTWSTPDQTRPSGALLSFCGGGVAGPPVPTGASVIDSGLVDAGTKGAQTFDQTALVHGDAAAAQAALATLRAVAAACPARVSVPAKSSSERREPAYTETATTSPLVEGEWSGFVLVRHKQYDRKHAAVADTAVSVLAKRNVVLVTAYAVYRLGATSKAPQFTADWQRLVGTILTRAGR